MLSRNFILGFAVLCFKASYALPSVSFPIDAQLPPIAVVGQPFSFSFSPATFTSALEISCSAKDLPAWLHFEASARTLSGTPAQNDIGNETLGLEATDSEGNTVAYLDLVVLANSSVRANQDLFAKQLSKSGSYSTPNALILSPETLFHLEIGPDVFESSGDRVGFYATSENHAPLPAWIHFDEVAVELSGTTPSLLTPQSSPQTFNFSLLASQIPRFSQSTINFQISVTNHVLAFIDPVQKFNVSAGNAISISPLIEQLQLDMKPVSRDQIAKISSNQPNWLTLRDSDLSFYGKAPEGVNNTTFQLEVDDTFNNVANVDIHLLVSILDTMRPQEVYLGTKHVTIGQQFYYTFPDIASGADVEVDLGLAASWLHFEHTNVSIQGVVPLSAMDDVFNVSATVRQDGQAVKLELLTLKVSDLPNTATNGSPGNETAVSQPTPTSTERTVVKTNGSSGKPLLAVIIIVPIILILLGFLILALLVRRSRKKRVRKVALPPPVRDGMRSPSSGSIVVSTEADLRTETDSNYQPPSLAPQVSIQWAQDRPPTRRPGSVVDTRTYNTPHTRSSWDDMLMKMGSPHGRSINKGPRSYGAASAVIADADAEQSSHSSTPLPLLTNRKGMLQTPSRADSGPTFRFDGRRNGGLGHGNSMAGTNMDLQRATLRSVPLSPYSESSPVASSMLEPDLAGSSLAFRDWAPSKTVGANSPVGGGKDIRRGSSSSSDGSRYENLEGDQHPRAYKHIRRRTASIPFSGSLWEDEEWMTEDSASKSGKWQSQGLPHSGSRVPTEPSFEEPMVRQWNIEPPRFTAMAVSNATSMRSQQSQQSQSNSLRFI